MENIGQLLKNRRLQFKKSFDEIHAQTRIAVEHLQFLEENTFDFLPETYIKSFLKTYAAALDLNGDEVLGKYHQNKQEQKAEEEKEQEALVLEKTSPSAAPTNRILEWSLAAGAFLLLVFIILVYLQYRIEIYARPVEHRNGHVNSPDFIKEAPAPAGVTTKSFQLRLVGLDDVAVQMDVTGLHEYGMSNRQSDAATITAVERFDIVLDEARGIKLKFDGMEMTDLGATGGKLRLSVVRASSR